MEFESDDLLDMHHDEGDTPVTLHDQIPDFLSKSYDFRLRNAWKRRNQLFEEAMDNPAAQKELEAADAEYQRLKTLWQAYSPEQLPSVQDISTPTMSHERRILPSPEMSPIHTGASDAIPPTSTMKTETFVHPNSTTQLDANSNNTPVFPSPSFNTGHPSSSLPWPHPNFGMYQPWYGTPYMPPGAPAQRVFAQTAEAMPVKQPPTWPDVSPQSSVPVNPAFHPAASIPLGQSLQRMNIEKPVAANFLDIFSSPIQSKPAEINNRVPRDMPGFRLETVNAKNRVNFDHPKKFLERFEITLMANAIDLDANWERLLLLSLDGDRLSWARGTILGKALTWMQFCTLFQAHFLDSFYYQQKQRKLMDTAMGNRTVQQFADHWIAVMNECAISHADPYFVSEFSRRLPVDIQRHLMALDDDKRATMEAVTSFAIRQESVEKNLPSSQTKTWKSSRHQNSSQEFSRGSYRDNGRNEGNRNYGGRRDNERPRDVGRGHSELQERPCHHCGELGHWRPACPLLHAEQSRASGRQPHNQSRDRRDNQTQSSPRSQDLVPKPSGSANSDGRRPMTQAAKPQSARRAEVEAEMNDEDDGNHPELEPQNEDSAFDMWETSSGDSVFLRAVNIDDRENQPLIPVLVAGIRTLALVDSGAGPSFISTRFVKEHNLNTISAEGRIKLANTTVVPRLGFTAPVCVKTEHRQVEIIFEIMEIADLDVYFGFNDFPSLGIALMNLPTRYADAVISTPDPIVPAEVSESFDILNKTEMEEFLKAIQPELDANIDLPVTATCQLPEAVVHINTPPGVSSYRPQYNIAHAARPAVDKQVQTWLETECIYPGGVDVEWNNPILAVLQKEYRICGDFRGVNEVSQEDKYPLPVVDELIDKLKGAKVYTKLDCRKAFHALLVATEDQHKTAFQWNGKVYFFRRAPFGLKQLPSKFMRVMHIIFDGIEFVVIFIDDIVVYSFDVEAHIGHVRAIIHLLTKNGFKLNLEKCKFAQSQINFCGHVVTSAGSYINPEKLIGCETWPVPNTGKAIQRFLGFVNYWRDCIPLLASLTTRLDALRHEKRLDDLWTKEHQEDYDRLILILKQGLMLHHADFSHPFYGASDASGTGIGGVVYQIIEGSTRYIAFYSRSLTPSERNYSATKRELLALIFTLRKGHYYFWGTPFEFFTDHATLMYIRTQKSKLSPMVINWFDELATYNPIIHHRPGITNILPDTLSRLYPTSNREYHVRGAVALPLAEPMEVPEKKQQKVLLEEKHLLGHFGAAAVVKAIQAAGFSWPNMHRDAQQLVSSCVPCQRYNIGKRGFHPISAVTAMLPGDHIAFDLGGPYAATDEGFIYLLIIIDICTRFCFLRPLLDKRAATIAIKLVEYFMIFGFPKIMQSDNGGEFVNAVIKEVKSAAGIDHRLITPYNAASNGVSEAWVKLSTTAIKKKIEGVDKDWGRFVHSTQYALNLKVSRRHGSTPFSLFFARSPNGFEDFSAVQSPNAPFDEAAYIKKLKHFVKVVFPIIKEKENKYIETTFNTDRRVVNYPAGAFVMARVKGLKQKMAPPYEGPFKIIRRNKGGAYLLQNTAGKVLDRNYAPSELKLVSHDPDDHADTFSVSKVVAHRGKSPNYEYLVRWRGYSEEDDTWEPTKHFNDLTPIRKRFTSIEILIIGILHPTRHQLPPSRIFRVG